MATTRNTTKKTTAKPAEKAKETAAAENAAEKENAALKEQNDFLMKQLAEIRPGWRGCTVDSEPGGMTALGPICR